MVQLMPLGKVVLGDCCSSFWPLAHGISLGSGLPHMLLNIDTKLLSEIVRRTGLWLDLSAVKAPHSLLLCYQVVLFGNENPKPMSGAGDSDTTDVPTTGIEFSCGELGHSSASRACAPSEGTQSQFAGTPGSNPASGCPEGSDDQD